MRTRAEQKEKRRQELLDLSLSLFVHRGYHGTTVRDIADRAEVSVGLLFHYFPTKQAILEELLRVAEKGIGSVVLQLEAFSPQGPDPLEVFDQVARTIFESFGEPPMREMFLLVNQIKTMESLPEVAGGIRSSSATLEASIPLIRRGQEKQSIRTGDPRSLAVAFWGAIQGIAEILVWFPDAPIPDHRCVVDVLRKR